MPPFGTTFDDAQLDALVAQIRSFDPERKSEAMKKIMKRVLAGIGALIVCSIIVVIVKFYVLSPKSRPAPVMTAPTNAGGDRARRYLVHHVAACVGCHSPVQEDSAR